MNHIKGDVYLLSKRKPVETLRYYKYSFLDILLEYNVPVDNYYIYLLSQEEFKLKNIWNRLISRWNKMKMELDTNRSFQASGYKEKVFHQIHEDMTDSIFNELITDFINSDNLKSLFVCNVIQFYIKGK